MCRRDLTLGVNADGSVIDDPQVMVCSQKPLQWWQDNHRYAPLTVNHRSSRPSKLLTLIDGDAYISNQQLRLPGCSKKVPLNTCI